MSIAEPIRVLVFDVASTWVQQVEPKLQSAGLQTFLANSCSELLVQARQGHFDVVIVACELCEVDQADLPHIIRNINCAQYLPIIWIAHNANPTAITTALELGIDLVVDHHAPLSVLLAYILCLGRNKVRSDELLGTIDQLRGLLVDQAEDLNKLRNDNLQLQELSTRDPLTKLHNGRYMNQWLAQAYAYATRYRKPLSIMVIDIDHFKWINDCYGHLTGDRVLKHLAQILKNSVRDSDLVARYGGDEFLLALPDTPAENLLTLSSRILEELKQMPVEPIKDKRIVSCSIGSATYPSDRPAETYQDLIMLADQALYAAKRSGRAQLAQWHNLADLHRQAVDARHDTPVMTARALHDQM